MSVILFWHFHRRARAVEIVTCMVSGQTASCLKMSLSKWIEFSYLKIEPFFSYTHRYFFPPLQILLLACLQLSPDGAFVFTSCANVLLSQQITWKMTALYGPLAANEKLNIDDIYEHHGGPLLHALLGEDQHLISACKPSWKAHPTSR